MNVEDIKKLTVADLKKELKTRNLHVTGNKTELVQRLTDHLLNEERQILDSSGHVDESLLEGVHEDEVLGLSTSESLTIGSPIIPISSGTATATKAAVKRVTGPTATIKKPETVKSPIANLTAVTSRPGAPKSNEAGGEEMKKIRLKSTSSDTETTEKVTPKVSLSATDSDQMKVDRAKRFNLPLTDNDRKKLRAERFGTGSESGGSKTNSTSASITNSSVALDPEILMKRAQRFGAPVVKTSKTSSTKAESEDKLKQRQERFGLQQQQSESNLANDNLTKRKLRFGGGDGSSNAETNEKKKARAERFGVMVTNQEVN